MTPEEAGSHERLLEIAAAIGVNVIDDAPPVDTFVDTNGLRMHVRDWGHHDKPAVVFLHAHGSSAESWDLVCLDLRNDYRCISLNLRGHGRTDGVHHYGVEEPRADIRGAIEALGLEKAAIVGFHLGGNDALAYVGAYPDDVTAVAFLDVCPTIVPSGYTTAEDEYAAIARAVDFDEAADVMRRKPISDAAKEFRIYSLAHKTELRPDGTVNMRYQREAPATTAAEHGADYMAERRVKLWGLVPNVSCPALVVFSKQSIGQTYQNLAGFRDQLPNAELIEIEGASIHEDHPVEVIDALRTFLGRVLNG